MAKVVCDESRRLNTDLKMRGSQRGDREMERGRRDEMERE